MIFTDCFQFTKEKLLLSGKYLASIVPIKFKLSEGAKGLSKTHLPLKIWTNWLCADIVELNPKRSTFKRTKIIFSFFIIICLFKNYVTYNFVIVYLLIFVSCSCVLIVLASTLHIYIKCVITRKHSSEKAKICFC